MDRGLLKATGIRPGGGTGRLSERWFFLTQVLAVDPSAVVAAHALHLRPQIADLEPVMAVDRLVAPGLLPAVPHKGGDGLKSDRLCPFRLPTLRGGLERVRLQQARIQLAKQSVAGIESDLLDLPIDHDGHGNGIPVLPGDASQGL